MLGFSAMHARLLRLAVLSGVAGSGALAACGARTGLLVPSAVLDGGGEGADVVDGGLLSPDAPLPPIDATVPVVPNEPNDCVDAGSTLIYLVTSQNTLYSFYPPAAEFVRIGTIACPTPAPEWQPFSMAVDRAGRAYVLFSDQNAAQEPGQLFRVSTANADCSKLAYVGGQDGFGTFGMGFVGNADGVTETLYVALNIPSGSSAAPQLGVLDVTNFQISMVANISPTNIVNGELTGTGDGRLFAFYAADCTGTPPAPPVCSSSAIAQLDPLSGRALGNDPLTALPQTAETPSGISGWAFAFWGNDFYLFTTDPGTAGSIVTRFSPSDGSQVRVATVPELVVGAGVSTCAPQQ
jgi:hypothetical protein